MKQESEEDREKAISKFEDIMIYGEFNTFRTQEEISSMKEMAEEGFNKIMNMIRAHVGKGWKVLNLSAMDIFEPPYRYLPIENEATILDMIVCKLSVELKPPHDRVRRLKKDTLFGASYNFITINLEDL